MCNTRDVTLTVGIDDNRSCLSYRIISNSQV